MKFEDLKCCPFCGCKEYKIEVSFPEYHRFDGKEIDVYEDGHSGVWNDKAHCRNCGRYLGNKSLNNISKAVMTKLGIKNENCTAR